ncbi:uncharacterized protein BO80DRAFT_165888 [Aspergillus ibericus CBS 121593]|uniref:Uncharacterized protein n=1 Tax=Aspergillus ibericus CBS 121593 TaxID=1448316 RepID=A0A395GTK9_9EURO|nr:hypothetical protein BO80DRAFT_165888 [Aspergillus ibericus CBS 121593]RAK98288.1 hypothetical protein BO80DRAFT_165888 [Aspergillus ibericus CBS 121593]
MQNLWPRASSPRRGQAEERSKRFDRLIWDDEQDIPGGAHGALVLRGQPHRPGEAPASSGTAAVGNIPRAAPDSSSRNWNCEPPNDESTTWTPSMTKDTTIHYEMDIVEDVGSHLEEFSHLKRLGHFHAAEQYFQDSLSDFMGLPPVAIEYADMLVEQGAYKRLHHVLSQHRGLLGLKGSSKILPSSLLPEKNPSSFLYRANLQLIQAFSMIQSQGLMQEAYETVRSLERPMRSLRRRRRTEPTLPLDSAEIQVIRYALMILSQVEYEANLIPEHDFNFWSNWCYLYKVLVAEGRVWDARDIIIASVQAEGPASAWKWIFGVELDSPEAFSRLLADWDLHRYDESTYLAILDVLVSLSHCLSSYSVSIPERKDLLTAQRYLQHAQALATCLKENSAQMANSRPYIQWVIAEAELERKLLSSGSGSDLRYHLGMFPGLTLWRGAIPVYVPIKTENPTWAESKERGPTYDLLETALQASQSLEDYRTEALCLSELIYRSVEVSKWFTRLAHLQKSIQGDILGYHQTSLSRFLLVRTDKDSKDLLAEIQSILELRHFITPNYSLSGWCAVIVERALSHSAGQDMYRSEEDFRAIVGRFFPHLPQYIKDQLEYLGLDRIYNPVSKTGKHLESAMRHRSVRNFPIVRKTRLDDYSESTSDEEDYGPSNSLTPGIQRARQFARAESEDDESTTEDSFDTARSEDPKTRDIQDDDASSIQRPSYSPISRRVTVEDIADIV